jgi:hypothetical protein
VSPASGRGRFQRRPVLSDVSVGLERVDAELTVDVAKVEFTRQLEPLSIASIFDDPCSHTSNDVPNTRKNRIGPATSLSSMMCWSILPNGFKTAKVCHFISTTAFVRNLRYTDLHLDVTKVHAQLFHYTLSARRSRSWGRAADVGAVLRRICQSSVTVRIIRSPTYPSVPNAASHPVRRPDAPMPICPLTPGAANPVPYCAGYG